MTTTGWRPSSHTWAARVADVAYVGRSPPSKGQPGHSPKFYTSHLVTCCVGGPKARAARRVGQGVRCTRFGCRRARLTASCKAWCVVCVHVHTVACKRCIHGGMQCARPSGQPFSRPIQQSPVHLAPVPMTVHGAIRDWRTMGARCVLDALG